MELCKTCAWDQTETSKSEYCQSKKKHNAKTCGYYYCWPTSAKNTKKKECECGSEKLGIPHSDWCPKYIP